MLDSLLLSYFQCLVSVKNTHDDVTEFSSAITGICSYFCAHQPAVQPNICTSFLTAFIIIHSFMLELSSFLRRAYLRAEISFSDFGGALMPRYLTSLNGQSLN